MVVHVVTTPLMLTLPVELRGLHVVLLSAALMGSASHVSLGWVSENG
jgi:hypothetical protein